VKEGCYLGAGGHKGDDTLPADLKMSVAILVTEATKNGDRYLLSPYITCQRRTNARYTHSIARCVSLRCTRDDKN
jgi:hypothetical protein